MLELNGKPLSVITFSTDFGFQNLVSWNFFEFSVKKSFSIQELLHRKSKPHETKALAPLLIKSFPKTPRT
jgi:hypothetical protein